MPVRFLLADDHAAVRAGIRQFLRIGVSNRTEAVMRAVSLGWIPQTAAPRTVDAPS